MVGNGTGRRTLLGGYSGTAFRLVPKGGLEPPRADAHMTLNHARLPVPPLRQPLSFIKRPVGKVNEKVGKREGSGGVGLRRRNMFYGVRWRGKRVLWPVGSPARESILRRRKIPAGAWVEVMCCALSGSWGIRTAIPHLRFAPAGGTPWPDASQVPPSSGFLPSPART